MLRAVGGTTELGLSARQTTTKPFTAWEDLTADANRHFGDTEIPAAHLTQPHRLEPTLWKSDMVRVWWHIDRTWWEAEILSYAFYKDVDKDGELTGTSSLKWHVRWTSDDTVGGWIEEWTMRPIADLSDLPPICPDAEV